METRKQNCKYRSKIKLFKRYNNTTDILRQSRYFEHSVCIYNI